MRPIKFNPLQEFADALKKITGEELTPEQALARIKDALSVIKDRARERDLAIANEMRQIIVKYHTKEDGE